MKSADDFIFFWLKFEEEELCYDGAFSYVFFVSFHFMRVFCTLETGSCAIKCNDLNTEVELFDFFQTVSLQVFFSKIFKA